MNRNEVLKRIQVLLGLQKFDDATLADGTKITNKSDERFAPGQNLYVVDAEGNEVNAPEGEHTTDSGIVLTVDANGVITGVKEPDMEGEGSLEAKKEKMEEYSPAEKIVEVAEAVAETGLSPEAVLEMVSPIIEEISSLKEEVAMMKKEFEDYKNGPAATSMKKTFSKMSASKNEAEVIDAYSRLVNIRKELRQN